MQIINISNQKAITLAIKEIHQQPILVQFPTVFALMAAPTLKGAKQLDAIKERKSGKNYGSAIGSLNNFLELAVKEELPEQFCTPAAFRHLKGSFIRLRFCDHNFQSHTICNGTHQGILLGGAHHKLFQEIERSFEEYTPDEIWNHRKYCAPLCTSANISGDPDGSIVTYDKALAFAKERGIGLFITCNKRPKELGSYPILGFEHKKIAIHRVGPGLSVFKARLGMDVAG